jgi:hypothetical protein
MSAQSFGSYVCCYVRCLASINREFHIPGISPVGSTTVNPLERSSCTLPPTGFSSDPLSTLSFSQPRLEELAVPFTPELRRQHGLEVSCLPYSISPVHLPKLLKSPNSFRFTLSDDTCFDLGSTTFSMVCVDCG